MLEAMLRVLCDAMIFLGFSISSVGCFHDESMFSNHVRSEHSGSGLGDVTQRIRGPVLDRCQEKSKGSGIRQSCDDALYVAKNYVRALATGDSVCLQGGFGLEPTRACSARAMVRDVHMEEVLLEIRESKPDSKWFDKQSAQFWFVEGALMDLYLDEHGY